MIRNYLRRKLEYNFIRFSEKNNMTDKWFILVDAWRKRQKSRPFLSKLMEEWSGGNFIERESPEFQGKCAQDLENKRQNKDKGKVLLHITERHQ